MDDAPYVGDLDLDAANTREDLAALLRTVHTRADKPSLRTLEARTRHGPTPLSKTATAEMLRGVRFPRKAVMLAFLQACGIPEDQMESWRRTWERVAGSEEVPVRPKVVQTASGSRGHLAVAGQYSLPLARDAEVEAQPGRAEVDGLVGGMPVSAEAAAIDQLREQIGRLNSDNDRLRAQLVAIEQTAVEELSPRDALGGQRARRSAVRHRELGTVLRALRAESGITVEHVAEHLMCSQTKVRRMERGFKSGTARDVRDLCDLYGVTDIAKRDHLMELARPGELQSWPQSYGRRFSTYLELEADATSIKDYTSGVVPGLVQTADYARAVMERYVEVIGSEVLSPEVIEQRVEGRLARHHRLTEADPPHAWFILDEAALHRMVGGPAVMTAQLERLIEAAGLPSVTIQVIPYEVGSHPAVDSAFTILNFAANVDSVVYIEGLVGDLFLERPRDVEQYQRAFEALRSLALGEKESIARIAKVNKDLTDKF